MAERSEFQAKPVHILAHEVEAAIGRLTMAEGEGLHFVVVVRNIAATRTVVFSNATAEQATEMLLRGTVKIAENREHIPDLQAMRGAPQ